MLLVDTLLTVNTDVTTLLDTALEVLEVEGLGTIVDSRLVVLDRPVPGRLDIGTDEL